MLRCVWKRLLLGAQTENKSVLTNSTDTVFDSSEMKHEQEGWFKYGNIPQWQVYDAHFILCLFGMNLQLQCINALTGI